MDQQLTDFVNSYPEMAIAIERGRNKGLTTEQLINIYITGSQKTAAEFLAMTDEDWAIAADGVVSAGFPPVAPVERGDYSGDGDQMFLLGMGLSVIQEVERSTAMMSLLSHESFPSSEVEDRTTTILSEALAIDALSVALAREIALDDLPAEEALAYKLATGEVSFEQSDDEKQVGVEDDHPEDEIFED